MRLVRLREVAQMDALRRVLVDASYQVLVDLLRHEGNHGRRRLGDGYKSRIKRHIRVDLILLHSLGPETLPASSYVPVGHIVHKFLQRSRDD